MKATSIANHEKTFFEIIKSTDEKEFILIETTISIKGKNKVML